MANFKVVIEPTIKWEGGLSRDPADPASAYPSPYLYKGIKGWHTNKGVTYATFETLAPVCGYQNNSTNFLTMPEWLHKTIVKCGFWDYMNLDQLKSPGIAFLLFNWKWASGDGWRDRMYRYLLTKDITWSKRFKDLGPLFNTVLEKYKEADIINEIADQQRIYANLVVEARKKKKNKDGTLKYTAAEASKYIKGWLNRIEDTRKKALGLIQQAIQTAEQAATTAAETVKKNKISLGAIAAAGIILYYLNKKFSFFK